MSQASDCGRLFVVATPIGNLGDMVPRAIEILQSVACIAAEDTRHSARLLAHFEIDTPLTAYHDHSDNRRTEELLGRLLGGEDLALISDAGTPLVSDPGYRLVRRARLAGVPVVPVPGACALVAALSAAGLPSDRFAFEGFLPSRRGARCSALERLAGETRTLIFYEAPHRVAASLVDMAEAFGPDREVVLARELTKTFETLRGDAVGALAEWVAADPYQQRGEIVLLVAGASTGRDSDLDGEARRVMALLLDELPVKRAAALAARITGARKNALYQWAIAERE